MSDGDPAAGDTFADAANEVVELYSEGRYDDALALSARTAARFPDRRGTTAFWFACLRALTGDGDGAVEALHDALAEGHWWAEEQLRDDPDLASLQGREDFERVVAESNRRRAAANADRRPELLVFEPLGPPRGLLITLHGAAWRPEEFAAHWRGAAEAGMVVGVPGSSQLTSSEGAGWTDEKLAAEEVAAHVERLQADHDIRPDRTVLGGFSQGGRVALRTALAGEPFAVAGFVLAGPAVRPEHVQEWSGAAASAAARGVRGAFIVGERDPVREPVEALNAELTAQGLACTLEIVPGLGHSFPQDFDARLARALDVVLPEEGSAGR
jgi:predicted esterase